MYNNIVKRVILLYFFIFCQSVLAQEEPQVLVPHPVFDFGRILAGEQVKAIFEVHNKGQVPLHISGVRTSCGCTTALMDQPTVAPGSLARIRATFQTHGRVGNQNKTISFNTNDPKAQKVELKLVGKVQPRLTAEPKAVYLKGGTDNQTVRTLLVNNYSNPDFKILNVSTSSKYIAVTPESPLGTANKLQRFNIEFKQGYPHEKVNERVALFTNDPLQPVIWISVWGRGR